MLILSEYICLKKKTIIDIGGYRPIEMFHREIDRMGFQNNNNSFNKVRKIAPPVMIFFTEKYRIIVFGLASAYFFTHNESLYEMLCLDLALADPVIRDDVVLAHRLTL